MPKKLPDVSLSGPVPSTRNLRPPVFSSFPNASFVIILEDIIQQHGYILRIMLINYLNIAGSLATAIESPYPSQRVCLSDNSPDGKKKKTPSMES